MENIDNVREMLGYINADDYDIYLKVVASLKYSATMGDMTMDDARNLAEEWAATSSKFDPVEFETKWKSLRNENGGAPCTMATITHLAKMGGMTFGGGGSNEVFHRGDIIDFDPKAYEASTPHATYVEGTDMSVSEQRKQIFSMLSLYDDTDLINIVTDYTQRDGKYLPIGNGKTRTVADWRDYITKNIAAGRPPLNNDIDPMDPDHRGETTNMGGVWIRINPLDGKGIKNTNVASFKYVLVESDVMDKPTQIEAIKKMGLPYVMLNDSGGKSIHAIINVGAANMREYTDSVNWLYTYCEAHGFRVDKADRNPSRLTRLPGCKRGNNWQYNVTTGPSNYTLKDFQSDLEVGEPYDPGDDWDSYDPEKEKDPELIKGLLIQGGVMGIVSSSKAGKTTLLTSLATAISTGTKWIDTFEVAQGKVIYCNMELTSKYFKSKIHEVGDALGLKPHITVFDLADKDIDLPKLSRRLERVCSVGGYKAIVIDPIYTLLDGDENKAQDVSRFMRGLHMLASRTNTSVIFAHHYSKGPAWVKADMDPMDRASGSGVFARSVDTLICLTRRAYVPPAENPYRTGWKVETVLRQYGRSPEFDVFFDYPLHHVDKEGILKDLPFYGDKALANAKKGGEASGEARKDKAMDKMTTLSRVLGDVFITKKNTPLGLAKGYHPDTGTYITCDYLVNKVGISCPTIKRYLKGINESVTGYQYRTKSINNAAPLQDGTLVVYMEKI